MKIIADLHIHSIASGHAFSTIQEIATEAEKIGLKIIGIADHGPCISGASSLHHFRSLHFVPRAIGGVTILRGAEANIIDSDGNVDISEHCLMKLDYAMVGFHEIAEYEKRDVKTNTKALLNVMDNPYIKVITHPGNPKFPIDYEVIVVSAKKKKVALEINNASFVTSRLGSSNNCELIAKLVAKHGGYVIVGSDAHISFDVGTFDEALKTVKAAGIKVEQVINSSKKRLFEFLNIKI